MTWTTENLKEYFERILNEKDKALTAALIAVKEENRKTEIAAEKRFELLNELRSGVATKEQLEALEKVVDDLKTSRDKWSGGYGIIVGAIGLIGGVIGIFYAVTK